MSFFQNLFDEYQGCWTLGDYKKYSLTFKVPGNKNRPESFICWNSEPYDLSSLNSLTFNFAIDSEFKNFASMSINVAGATPSATKASEIRDILNANANFSSWFVAGIMADDKLSSVNRVYIRQKRPATNFRFYVSNSGAERKLKFNKYGGIADIPSFFDKDTIANRFETEEANNKLIRLSRSISGNTVANPTVITSTNHGLSNGDTVYITGSNSTPTIDGQRTVTVTGTNTFTVPVNVTTAGTTGEWLGQTEYEILTDANVDYTSYMADWQHLRGRTDVFMFYKNTVDGSNRITSQIQWQAGAKAGDLAKRILYTYSGANTNPTTQLEIPYVLTASDLLRP
jgi:hypothetical protein